MGNQYSFKKRILKISFVFVCFPAFSQQPNGRKNGIFVQNSNEETGICESRFLFIFGCAFSSIKLAVTLILSVIETLESQCGI